MIARLTTSPYRSWRRALTHRRASLDARAHELVYVLRRLRCRDSRVAHRRVSRQLQRVRDELEETDILLGDAGEGAAPTEPIRWSSPGALFAAVLLLVLVVLSLGAARDTSRADGQTFDPNAIDGADTRPRTELE